MTIKLLNRDLINILIIFIIPLGIIFSKPVTLEKVEDLRLDMIEKKNKEII